MRSQLIFIFITLLINLNAQYKQERLFPELSGEELRLSVVDQYKASILFFDYGTTRDTMFREVYAVNDSLECVYSGHKLYMDPTKDPTTTVFMNGADNGINTEHTYPRSKGAGFGNARSDMHHLYPTRAMVNEERSNFPFGDIDDEETTKWFYKDQTLISRPAEDIDNYSEWKWQVFEPRESHKGNVARAVMYFYTMYKSQADQEDPNFFWDMLPDLCNWHFEDPVDSAEYARTWLISKWQQYPNPFILDCSLASRIYCLDQIDENCELAVPVKDVVEGNNMLVFYNSASDLLTIVLNTEDFSDSQIVLYDMNGRILRILKGIKASKQVIDVSDLTHGAYVVKWINKKWSYSKQFVK